MYSVQVQNVTLHINFLFLFFKNQAKEGFEKEGECQGCFLISEVHVCILFMLTFQFMVLCYLIEILYETNDLT